MTVDDLVRFRRRADLTQGEMARAMGLSLRAYQDIEGREDDDDLSTRHVLAIERCSLSLAVQRNSIDLALPSIRRDAQDFMDLFRGARAA